VTDRRLVVLSALKWSGDANPDPFAARIVYIHQDLIIALRAVAGNSCSAVRLRELSRRVSVARGRGGLLALHRLVLDRELQGGTCCVPLDPALGFYLAVAIFIAAMYGEM
jgi:hypothetical protein